MSLGSSICLEIWDSNEDGIIEKESRWKILQEPRSLLITSDRLYTDYLHGIADSTEDTNLNSATVCNWDLLRSTTEIVQGCLQRSTRTSLTYRDVIKVSRLNTKFPMFGKRG